MSTPSAQFTRDVLGRMGPSDMTPISVEKAPTTVSLVRAGDIYTEDQPPERKPFDAHDLLGIERPQTEQHGFKSLGGQEFAPEYIQQRLKEKGYYTKADLTKGEGGLVEDKDGTIVASIRPDSRRGGRQTITVFDFVSIARPENLSLRPEGITTGFEIEFLAFNPQTGDIEPAMTPDHPVKQAIQRHNEEIARGVKHGVKIPISDEILNAMVEFNAAPGKDGDFALNERTIRQLQELVRICEDHHVLLAPVSVLPHRDITPEDISQDEYLRDVAFVQTGWARVRYMKNFGIHQHAAIFDLQAGLEATTESELLTPFTDIPSHAGPFLLGTMTPDLQPYYSALPDIETDKRKRETFRTMLTEGIWETHRPVAMMMSSTSGGIIEKPFAPTEQELWEIIDRQLRIERSEGGVGRSNGRHRRRFRPDLGTTEDTSHDTAGGNFFLIIALRRLHREKTGKIMYHKKMGDFEQKIRAQYPELFGTEFPTPQTFDRVHANRMATAKNSQSLVQPLDGSHPVPATFLLNRVYEFVQAPDSYYTQAKHIGLPPGLHYVLRNASKPPTDYKNGLSTFYKIGGTGNLSQYMIHHCQQLMENQHMSEKDAIIQTTLDVAQAFHNHIKSLDPHEVAYLYKY